VSLCYKLSPFQALEKVTLHPRSQACIFTYSSCGKWIFPHLLCSFPPTTTFTSFPAPDYCVVLLLLPATLFVYSSCGKWVFPPLLWSFPPSATLISFPTPGCWANPFSSQSLSGLPSLFIYSPGKDYLPPIFGAQCAPPSFLCVFIALIAYYSVYLFSPGGGLSVQGAILLRPRLVCGSFAVLRSSLGLCLPKPSGRRQLAARGPSWFLCLTWSLPFVLFKISFSFLFSSSISCNVFLTSFSCFSASSLKSLTFFFFLQQY
jgi:hypothetical protein